MTKKGRCVAEARQAIEETTLAPEELTPHQAHELFRRGALLVDVREHHEWHAGHVPGSHHLPLGELPERADALPADRPVVVACKSGGRSARATAHLRARGYPAHNLARGLLGWHAAGLPLEHADGGPGQVI
jgi:rhodanese-related sulfurtransferase